MGRVLSFGYVRGLERGHYGRGGRYALVIHSSLVDYFADKQLQFILPEELVVIINLRVFSLGPRGNEFPLRTGGFRRGVYGRRGRRGGLCEGNETLLESWTFGEHSDAPNLEGKALTRSRSRFHFCTSTGTRYSKIRSPYRAIPTHFDDS